MDLHDEAAAAFARDGVACVRAVLDPGEVAEAAAAIDAVLARPGPLAVVASAPDDPGAFTEDFRRWQEIPQIERLARHSRVPAVAAALMTTPRVRFYHDHVLVKEGGTRQRTPWHQDQPYSPVDGWAFCTMWLPVDPVPRDMTLEFVAGSHRAGKWYRPQRFIDGSLRADDDPRWEVLPTIKPATHRIIGWAVEPGDCVVFHGLTLHGAAGNVSSSRPRRVLSTRWTGDDARFRRRSGKMSPPPPETGAPEDGAVLDCEAFPVVWQASAALESR